MPSYFDFQIQVPRSIVGSRSGLGCPSGDPVELFPVVILSDQEPSGINNLLEVTEDPQHYHLKIQRVRDGQMSAIPGLLMCAWEGPVDLVTDHEEKVCQWNMIAGTFDERPRYGPSRETRPRLLLALTMKCADWLIANVDGLRMGQSGSRQMAQWIQKEIRFQTETTFRDYLNYTEKQAERTARIDDWIGRYFMPTLPMGMPAWIGEDAKHRRNNGIVDLAFLQWMLRSGDRIKQMMTFQSGQQAYEMFYRLFIEEMADQQLARAMCATCEERRADKQKAFSQLHLIAGKPTLFERLKTLV